MRAALAVTTQEVRYDDDAGVDRLGGGVSGLVRGGGVAWG
jgi:hypothetical protein